ncbi:MAG: hypothetical protein O3A01_08245, partial [bacterium]|nr:hypothetical protein [bacterium]
MLHKILASVGGAFPKATLSQIYTQLQFGQHTILAYGNGQLAAQNLIDGSSKMLPRTRNPFTQLALSPTVSVLASATNAIGEGFLATGDLQGKLVIYDSALNIVLEQPSPNESYGKIVCITPLPDCKIQV